MSAVAYRPGPQRPSQPSASLRLVRSTDRARRIITARNITVIVIASLGIMLLRLFVSVQTDANAYQIADLYNQNLNLQTDAAFIQEQLDVLNSPQHLSDVAQGLGMISNSSPAYIRLSDGKMWGNPRVVSTGVLDSTAIANSLVDSIAPNMTIAGEPAPRASSVKTESARASVATAPTTGIPAPNTH